MPRRRARSDDVPEKVLPVEIASAFGHAREAQWISFSSAIR